MTRETILVVDDEANIVELARMYLEKEGFQVRVARDGEQALHMVSRRPPALMVLDLMLPKVDGWEVCRRIRAKSDLPIIMLTARVEDADKIVGLEMGADDYVTKPFNPREVTARVRALLRRSRPESGAAAQTLQVGRLRLDVGRRELSVDEQIVSLTPTEFELLRVLMEAPGYVFTRDELIEKGLGYAYAGMGRTLDSHIKNLRRKIEPDPRQPTHIQTVSGVGYRLADAAP